MFVLKVVSVIASVSPTSCPVVCCHLEVLRLILCCELPPQMTKQCLDCGHKTIYSSQMLKNSHYLSFTALMVIHGSRVSICSPDHYLHIRISANREQLMKRLFGSLAG